MSHFTVLVIGDDVKGQLAPFQENNMGDCPGEFLAFVETETEMRDDYENKGTDRIVMPDGTLRLPWDDCFKVPGSFGFGSDTHKAPEHLERREVPFKETYATFEEYVADWCGDEERDPKMGVFGYWHNPSAKWDWYQVGGRWTGFFLAKKTATEVAVGSPGLMTPQPEAGWVDQARKGDIDFEGMRGDAEKTARWQYALVVGTLGYAPNHHPWSFYRNDPSYGDGGAALFARREAYREQPTLKTARELLHEKAKSCSGKEEEFLNWVELDEFLCTEEEFVQRHRDQAISTFAVLKGKCWYEKGKMGWWGCVSDPKDEAEWLREFNLMLDTLDDDTLLTVVDCHI